MSQRQAAMVLLDAVSAFDHDTGDTPENAAALRLALSRLEQVDAITATVNDETGVVKVDANPVIGASLAMLTLLVRTLAEIQSADPDAVLNTLRQTISAVLTD